MAVGNDRFKRSQLLKNKIKELEEYKEYRRNKIQVKKDHIRNKRAIAEQERKELLLMQRKISDKELDLETYEKLIDDLNIRLDHINSDNEYHALITEIGRKEDDKNSLELEIQQLMIKLKVVDKGCEELTEELINDEMELKDLIKSIDEETMYHYKRLLNIQDGDPFAEVLDNACSSCYMKITLQTINSLKDGNNLVLCPSCKRILFFNEEFVPKNS
ncbi:MAG: zinc ribbon domain-containing protein [Planctomycetota bacterium]|jgi:predicted  nucleic acid-binding Zn-ribbon protein